MPGCRHPPFTERAIEEVSDQWAHWTKERSLLSQAARRVNGGAGRRCDRRPAEPPPAACRGRLAFDMWAAGYLFAGSFACLTKNLRMLLIPCCARRVLAGALRTLARSLALCVALETLAPGV